MTGLRQDRILEEATAGGTRDPMHFASMFGLHPNTARRYVHAAYGRHDLPLWRRPLVTSDPG